MIRLLMLAFVGLLVAASGGSGEDADVAGMLDAALKREKEPARRLAQQAIQLLYQQKLPAPAQDPLARRAVDVLRHCVQSPADVRAIFPPEQTQVSRQVFHRCYRERWTTSHPLSVQIVFECRKGADAVLLRLEPFRR